MSETPETDAAIQRFHANGLVATVDPDFARKLERDRNEARAEVARLREALQRLADCDWVITPHDRMDAVRTIAREALAAKEAAK